MLRSPPGDHLRLLDVALTHDVEDSDKPLIITIGTISEVYVVSDFPKISWGTGCSYIRC